MYKLLVALGSVLLLSCHSKTTVSLTNSDAPVCDNQHCTLPYTNEVVDTIAEDNWQLLVSGSGWVSVPVDDNSAIKVALVNDSLKSHLFFVKEATPATLEDYVMGTMLAFQQAGSDIEKVQSAVVESNQAVLLTLQKNDHTLWMWITVKQGSAYTFSCSFQDAPDSGDEHLDYCNSILRSVQIK